MKRHLGLNIEGLNPFWRQINIISVDGIIGFTKWCVCGSSRNERNQIQIHLKRNTKVFKIIKNIGKKTFFASDHTCMASKYKASEILFNCATASFCETEILSIILTSEKCWLYLKVHQVLNNERWCSSEILLK